MQHIATSEIFETTPGGVLGERYICTCGKQSTAAQMAGTRGGTVYSALFGHLPCAAIIELHRSGESRVEMEMA
jgi:hypothetical protein